MQSDPHDARILKAFALGLAVATRGMDHLRNRVTLEINARINDDPGVQGAAVRRPGQRRAEQLRRQGARGARLREHLRASATRSGCAASRRSCSTARRCPASRSSRRRSATSPVWQFTRRRARSRRPEHHGRRAADQSPPRRPPRATTRCRSAGSTSRSRSGPTRARRSIAREFDAMLSRFYEISNLTPEGVPRDEWRAASCDAGVLGSLT